MSILIGKRAEKILSIALSLTVIVWSLGLFALTANVASAATLKEGDLIRGPDGIKVYIINADGFKRHIFNPEVFNMYGHLKWSNIKAVDQTTVDSYKTSDLYRAENDSKVYSTTEDGKKSWINMTAAEFIAKGYSFSQVFLINAKENVFYAVGADITATTVVVTPVGGALSVMLDSSTSAAGYVAKGATDVAIASFKFTGGSSDSVISSIAIHRGGVSADADISNVKLFEGAAQLGSTQALNTTNSKATFSGLNWSLPANTAKVLKVTATIATSPTVGNAIQLGIDSANDIGGATFTGLPAYSNVKTIAGASVGTLTVDTLTSPAGNVISGSTDQWIGSIKFTTATEGFNISSLKVSDVGTSLDADVTNLKLKISGVQVGSTAATRLNRAATFDLSSAPITIASGASKTVDVYGDIASGITSSRTVITEVTKATDLVATGTNSGGSVTAVAAGTFPETGGTITATQGSFSAAADATNPTAQTYVKGTTGDTVLAIKVSAGSTEAVRVTEIKLTKSATGTMADTDISNISLWDGSTQIGGYAGMSGGTVTFGSNTTNAYDSVGLFDIAASGTKVITVKADVPTGAATLAAMWGLKIAAHGDVKADGVSSKNDLPACTSCTVSAVDHTTSVKGDLTNTVNSATPAAANVAKNTTAVTFAKFDLTATGEDVIATAWTVKAYNTSNGSTTTAVTTGDITNMKLMDGTTQLGSTVTNPSSGVGTFSFALTIPKNSTKTLSVIADVPTGTTASYLWVKALAADVTNSGAASGASIVATGDVSGKVMTVLAPTLTVGAASTPVATATVVNSSSVTVGSIVLTAGTAEDVRVSSIKISADDSTAISTTSAANTSWNTFKLMQGATQIGTTKNLTDGTPDSALFDGLSVNIPKGTSVTLDIKANAVGSATAWYFGVLAAGDVVSAGVSSNTSITATLLATPVVSTAQTLTTAGTLTTAVASDKPSASQISVGTAGTTGVEFSRFTFTANTENIKLQTLTLTRTSGADSDFASVKLYDGTTLLGTATLGATTAGKATFNFASGLEPVFTKDVAKTLSVKADVNGSGAGTTSTDAPKLEIYAIGDVVAQGASSGSTINASATTTTSNAMTLLKTTVTASLATTSSPGGASPAGASTVNTAQDVMHFDVKNNGTTDATINSVKFTIGYSTSKTSGATTFAATRSFNLYDSADLTTSLGTITNNSGTTINGATIPFVSLSKVIAGGATKTFVLKGDTTDAGTGTAGTSSIQFNVAAIADFSWNDGVNNITTLTKNFPLNGNTLTY